MVGKVQIPDWEDFLKDPDNMPAPHHGKEMQYKHSSMLNHAGNKVTTRRSHTRIPTFF
jgi:hypothetical protein